MANIIYPLVQLIGIAVIAVAVYEILFLIVGLWDDLDKRGE